MILSSRASRATKTAFSSPYTQNNISYFGGMYRKNKGVPGLELATYRHAHQKQACTLLYTCVACFFFLFWWDVALYPTLKQTAVLGCIKNSTSAVTRALPCQLRGRPFHPWAGRLRFSGEAHPGPATLTQSSSFSCGAGLQSECRLLLCCAPVTRDHATHVYSSVHACC